MESNLYLFRVAVEDGSSLSGEELINACLKVFIDAGNGLSKRDFEVDKYYLILKKGGDKAAIKVNLGDLDSEEELMSNLNKLIGSNFSDWDVYSDYSESITMAFYAKETEDGDLWSYEFDRLAKYCCADVTIIGMHSKYKDYAIQQQGDDDAEGVVSNPKQAKEYYVGLETGLSLKTEGLKTDDFDLSNYTVQDLK